MAADPERPDDGATEPVAPARKDDDATEPVALDREGVVATAPEAPLRVRKPRGVGVPGFSAFRRSPPVVQGLLFLALLTVLAFMGTLGVWHYIATREGSELLPPSEVAGELVRNQRIRVRRIHFDIPEPEAAPPEPEPPVVVHTPKPDPEPELEPLPTDILVEDLTAQDLPQEPEPGEDCEDDGSADLGTPDVAMLTAPGVAEPGVLFVSSRPWSRVYVDGDYLGRSNQKYDMTEGLHAVMLRTPDGEEAEVEVIIPSGETTRLCWDFASESRCGQAGRVKEWGSE